MNPDLYRKPIGLRARLLRNLARELTAAPEITPALWRYAWAAQGRAAKQYALIFLFMLAFLSWFHPAEMAFLGTENLAWWLSLTSLFYASLVGGSFGAIEVLTGSEAFAFALPATRRQRYRAAWWLGLGTSLAFCILGFLITAPAWPGLEGQFPRGSDPHLYGLALPLSILTFCLAHARNANSRDKEAAAHGWKRPFFLILIVILLGDILVGGLSWTQPTSAIQALYGGLLILGLLVLSWRVTIAGERRYVNKEVGLATKVSANSGSGD